MSQFLGGTRWGSPVAAGALSAALLWRISASATSTPRRSTGLGVGSFVSMGSTSLLPESRTSLPCALAAGFVLLLLPIQVHPPGGKWPHRGARLAGLGGRPEALFRPPDAR